MIYDPFQKEAIEHIKSGHSVIVSAPTGSGKTVIAEYVINDCLAKGESVIYTAPIKALSNQKFRDFREIYQDKIGILTGDVSINTHAPVLIMTTEIFRNKLLEKEESLSDYSWIIFDEIHYIDDYERGTVWEESLIFLPQHMKLLALSATIPNIDELAGWIAAVHKKPIKTIKEDKRPVPLHFFYQCQGKIHDELNKLKALTSGVRMPHHYRGRKFYAHPHVRPNRPDSLIKHLSENDHLPCIYFSFGRRRCEDLADEMSRFNFLNVEEGEKIKRLYSRLCERFGLSGDKAAARARFFIERGIAYHHAGMIPTLKEVIERLFTSRLIKVIFTTETFSLGINMPARTVAFDTLRKFYGRFRATIKTRDFYQMAGRAGRRGIDNEGFVYARVNPHDVSFQDLERIVRARPERVASRFNASYATILNLYQKYGEGLYDVYPRSFHYFQQTKHLREKAARSLRAKVNVLKEAGCIRQNALTRKGTFAAKIYGYELSLSELYEKGILEHLSSDELGILATALVYEPRRGVHRPPLTKKAKRLREITESTVRRVHRMEKSYGIIPLSKVYYYYLTQPLMAWMGGEPFYKVMAYTDEDEGSVIRYFRMSIQILREILDTPVSASLKDRARKVIGQINKGMIDAEKQLRM